MRPLVYYFLKLTILVLVPFICLFIYAVITHGSNVAIDAFLFIDKYLLFILVIILSGFIHETGHYLTARKSASAGECKWEITWIRTSLICTGNIVPKERIRIALAGPIPCLVIGIILCIFPITRPYGIVFCLHLVFLLPCFGDGRQLLAGTLHLLTQSIDHRREQKTNN